jgi:aspartyl/asparaginyl beta-hydroxylase (cupin superfamily)
LQVDPRAIPALLMKGELYQSAGDDRAAVGWFKRAMTLGAQLETVPPELAEGLNRAAVADADYAARFAKHLDQSLAAAGVATGTVHSRFGESLDILTGKREVFLQQPTSFFYPGLPHRQFFDPADFPWIAAMEAAAPAMAAEARAVLASGEGLAPYVEADPTRPNRGHALLGKAEWSAFYFWQYGEKVCAHQAKCPATAAALEQAPLPMIEGRSPMALYSVLKPKTHIPPHNGMLNTRLICHIPLIVPPGCRLRVGNETRAVETGKALIFDDSIEHEAWNDSDETRVILLFEIWRPELQPDEVAALTAMFSAISSYPGG